MLRPTIQPDGLLTILLTLNSNELLTKHYIATYISKYVFTKIINLSVVRSQLADYRLDFSFVPLQGEYENVI